MGEFATLAPDQQHLRALQEANRVRLARAEMKREIAAGDLAGRGGDPELPLAGAQHVDQRPADEPEAVGTGALPPSPHHDRRPREQASRDPHRATARRPRRRPQLKGRAAPTAGAAGPERRLTEADPDPCSRVGVDARPGGRQLDDVAVGVAQVDRLEEGPVHHLRARHPLRGQVVAPALQLLVVADREGEVVGRARRRPLPSSSSGYSRQVISVPGLPSSSPKNRWRAPGSSSLAVCLTIRSPRRLR